MSEHRETIEFEDNDSPGGEAPSEFETLYHQSLTRMHDGSLVKGRVVQVRSSAVVIDLGHKSDGIIPAEQFSAEELAALRPGDELEVFLVASEDRNGNILLSREKAKKMEVWDRLNHAFQTGAPIKGRVVSKTKGGLSVDIGVVAFLPASQIDVRPLRSVDSYIGQTLDLKIIKMNPGRGNIVLSRRALLDEQHSQQRQTTLSGLEEGKVVTGLVKNITEYGAFVDLGGIDGLLHVTDMSWGRVSHPSSVVKPGDRLDVVVLKYDREKQKISLGLKQKTADPWQSVAERYLVGSRVKGRVVNLAEYGAFVELEPGVEGLVHVSEMSWTQKVKHPAKVMNAGDVIEAQVLAVDPAAKRISLGIKQLQPNPWDTVAERYPAGSRIQGKVKTITDFGAFVGIEDGIDGLIHVTDLSWTKHIKHPSEVLKKGQTTEAVVLSVDRDRERVSLGLRQLSPDPWSREIPERYRVGGDETVTVTKRAEFGVFVELEQGLEGLIPTSEIPRDAGDLQEGAEVTARVIKVDTVDRKIALSIKAHLKGQDRAELQEYRNQQDKFDTTIGSLIKDRG